MADKEEVIIRAKEKKYKGYSLEHLQSLSAREVAKFMPSRQRRTILRNSDKVEKFVKSCEDKIKKKKKIKTHLRDMVIVPKLVGMSVAIHNGKSFQEVPITFEMLGHRLGEFAVTTQKVNHSAAGIGATRGSRAKKK